jgi:hypothetical protein
LAQLSELSEQIVNFEKAIGDLAKLVVMGRLSGWAMLSMVLLLGMISVGVQAEGSMQELAAARHFSMTTTPGGLFVPFPP